MKNCQTFNLGMLFEVLSVNYGQNGFTKSAPGAPRQPAHALPVEVVEADVPVVERDGDDAVAGVDLMKLDFSRKAFGRIFIHKH
jgi:hypothetical protein